jgi:hypothetical protein
MPKTLAYKEYLQIPGVKRFITFVQIYNLARRIVIGELQNIVFGEFLSTLIGTSSLFPASTKSTIYNPSVDPSISSEFSASAFRCQSLFLRYQQLVKS